MAKKKKPTDTDEGGGVAVAEAPQTSAVPIELLPLTVVRPSPTQPRKYFDPVKMDELKADLARRGQQDPVKVKPLNEEGFYDLVDGERRWRCLQDLAESASGDATLFIEARIVNPADEVETLLNQLAANMHREGLTPVEEARAFATLEEAGLGADDIANRLGIASRTVYTRLALLDLCVDVLTYLEQGVITVSHADELVKLPEFRQVAALGYIGSSGASVRALREWLDSQGWTKKSQAEVVGDDDGEIGHEEAAMENAGRAYDREQEEKQTDGGGDVVGEAAEDLKRQQESLARAEAARKERQADETPDEKTASKRGVTEDEQLAERVRARIAAKLVKAVTPNEAIDLVFANARRAWRAAPFGRKSTASPWLKRADPSLEPEVLNMQDAARVLLALDLAELVLNADSRLGDFARSHRIDIELCKLEERAESLGVSVKELKKQDAAKRAADPVWRNGETGELAPDGLRKKPWVRGTVDEHGNFHPDKKSRGDKGKTRRSPKVAKKMTGTAIRAAVKAAGKAKTPKAKKKKK